MSTALYYEPRKLPSGVLALLVHILFFALLYFGFNWNRQAYVPATMTVSLWSNLPQETVKAQASPKTEEVMPQPQPEKIANPDIAIPDKRKTEVKPVETKPEKKETERRAAEEARKKAELAKQQEQAAALSKLIDEYKAKIQSKIRRNIVQPQTVSEDARAEFLVTLLPGGDVLTAKLIKSSGNKAYDDQVERAILKSSPLPLPQDVQLFNRFRELDLTFKPDRPAE